LSSSGHAARHLVWCKASWGRLPGTVAGDPRYQRLRPVRPAPRTDRRGSDRPLRRRGAASRDLLRPYRGWRGAAAGARADRPVGGPTSARRRVAAATVIGVGIRADCGHPATRLAGSGPLRSRPTLGSGRHGCALAAPGESPESFRRSCSARRRQSRERPRVSGCTCRSDRVPLPA
jgi:hypothetical protein